MKTSTHYLDKNADTYWAQAPLTELPDVVRAIAERYWDRLEGEGRIDLWRRLERTYYGLDERGGWGDSTAVTFSGDTGENVMVRVNEFRSIVRAIIALVTADRPAFVAQALSSDAASLDAAPLCEGIVTSYYETRGLEDVANETARLVCLLGEGYTHLRWDAFAGKIVGQEQRYVYEHGKPKTRTEEREVESLDEATGLPSMRVEQVDVPETETFPVREGDIAARMCTPIEVVRDLDDHGPMRWAIVAHSECVWDLAARYPELRERILDQRGRAQWMRRMWDDGPGSSAPVGDQGNDMVTVWCVYHLACDAVPTGRYALVCGDVVLTDGPLALTSLPVIPLIPEREHGTVSGDAPIVDLLCLQEVYDAVWSAIMTPVDAFAIQNVTVPEGANISAEMLGKGLQLLKYTSIPGAPNGGAPTPLQLLRTPEELWRLIELIPQRMQAISGINSVTRGAPDSNIKAGNYAALISAQAQQYHGPLARGVLRHHEQIGTMVLETLRAYATTTRIAEIVGHDRQTAVKEFKGSDIATTRVSLDMTNPLTRQMSGRLEIGQMLLAQPGMVQTPEQFMQFLSSGRIEPLYRAQVSQLTLIRRENEALADGKAPPVALIDRHDLHIAEHAAVINDPDLRTRRPDVMQAVLDHLMEHVAQLERLHTLPALALATGQRLPPSAGAMHPPAEMPAPPGGMPEPPEPGRAQVPGTQTAVPLPMMPANPATGERAAPPIA